MKKVWAGAKQYGSISLKYCRIFYKPFFLYSRKLFYFIFSAHSFGFCVKHFIINNSYRQACSRIFCTLAGIVRFFARFYIIGISAVQSIIGTPCKICIIHNYFIAITAFACSAIFFAVRPYSSNNSDGLPDFPNLSVPIILTGTGALAHTVSVTALPSPPII